MAETARAARAPRDGIPVTLIILGLLAGMMFVPRVFSSSAVEATQGPLVGKPAPAFSLPLVANGEAGQSSISLADLKGSAVILDFWATWCGPCKAEAPIVNGVASRFKDKGLKVVGINTSDRAGLGGPWSLHNHIGYPIAFDTRDGTANDYGVTALPTLVVISRTGEVIAVREGPTDADELESLVKKAL